MRLFLVSFLSVLLCSFSSAIEVPDADWTRLESIFQTLKEDNGKLKVLLNESETNLTEARLALTSAQEELTTLKQSLSETKNSLQRLTTSLSAIKNDSLLWAVGASVGAGLLGVVLGLLAP